MLTPRIEEISKAKISKGKYIVGGEGGGVGEPKKNRVRGVEIFWNGTFILPNATKYANKLDKKTLHSN